MVLDTATEKQLEVIRNIEQNLRISFTGSTKDEARLFISKHLDESKKVRIQYHIAIDEYTSPRSKQESYYDRYETEYYDCYPVEH